MNLKFHSCLFYIFVLFASLSFATSPIQEPKPVRILVLEGGGIHGVLSARVLQALEKEAHLPLSQLFDIMVGTSSGALQVALLNMPKKGTHEPQYSTSDLVNFYNEFGQKALKIPFYRDLETVWGIAKPRISSKNLKNYLQQKLQDYSLKDALTTVIIPVFDLNTQSLFIFNSNDASLANYKFVDILLGATAIPNIIAAHPLKINNEIHYLNDAALVSNNPVILAMFEASLIYPNRPLIIVSLGNGKEPPPSNPKLVGSQGTSAILNNWMTIIYKGSDHSTRYLMHKLEESRSNNIIRYYRIDPMVSIGRGGPLDVSLRGISLLKTAADSYIKTHPLYFTEIVTTLKDSKTP